MKLDIIAQIVQILKDAPEVGAIEIRRGLFGAWSSVRVSKAGHGNTLGTGGGGGNVRCPPPAPPEPSPAAPPPTRPQAPPHTADGLPPPCTQTHWPGAARRRRATAAAA